MKIGEQIVTALVGLDIFFCLSFRPCHLSLCLARPPQLFKYLGFPEKICIKQCAKKCSLGLVCAGAKNRLGPSQTALFCQAHIGMRTKFFYNILSCNFILEYATIYYDFKSHCVPLPLQLRVRSITDTTESSSSVSYSSYETYEQHRIIIISLFVR